MSKILGKTKIRLGLACSRPLSNDGSDNHGQGAPEGLGVKSDLKSIQEYIDETPVSLFSLEGLRATPIKWPILVGVNAKILGNWLDGGDPTRQ